MRVNDRVKDAPASALRALAAGIGQVLGMTDKLRAKSAASPEPKTDAPENGTHATATVAAPASAPEAGAAPDVPGSTAGEPAAADAAAAAEPRAAAKPRVAAKPRSTAAANPATAKPTAAKPAAAKPAAADAPAAADGHVKLLPPDAAPAAKPAAAAPVAAASAELPLANYDDLTVASLRARLRNLSADQLNQLIGYEKDHAGRADVITMFERRIAKLAEG